MVAGLGIARDVDVLDMCLHTLTDAHLNVDGVALYLGFYWVDGKEQVAIIQIK